MPGRNQTPPGFLFASRAESAEVAHTRASGGVNWQSWLIVYYDPLAAPISIPSRPGGAVVLCPHLESWRDGWQPGADGESRRLGLAAAGG